MSEEAKNIWDVALTIIGTLGALVAFMHTLATWRDGQRWKRSEQLDKFIERFETDELLKLAASLLDWSDRPTTFRGQQFVIRNNDVLLALRVHHDQDGSGQHPKYSVDQAIIRDALDAYLSFLVRLEIALKSGLIDVDPTKQYFAYWVQRLVTMDRHPDKNRVLKDHRLPSSIGGKTGDTLVPTPPKMAKRYIESYSDSGIIEKLCKQFSIPW